jgi:DNA-binding winged helix-turn-helix (wHTH) protein
MGDSVLSANVAKLRKALGHKKGRTEYIDNLYGRCYRFTRPVTVAESSLPRTDPTTTLPRPSKPRCLRSSDATWSCDSSVPSQVPEY